MVASLVLFIVTTVGARLVPDEVVNSLTQSVLTHAQGLFSESAHFCSLSP